MSFSNREYAEMHFIYGLCNGNTLAARREYQSLYPDRTIPSPQVFTRVHQRLLETGSVEKKKKEVGPVHDVAVEEYVLQRVEDNPGTSTRQLAIETGMSRWKVHKVLKENYFHPYHFNKVQGLEPRDYETRREFCRWLLQRDIVEYHFFKKILWTDECRFTREGVINFQKMHLWKKENPKAPREASLQRRFGINVWAGVIGDRFIGPHIFESNLNGDVYLDFLQHSLPQLLDGIEPRQRAEIIFQQDGAPPHFTEDVRLWLTQNYPTWIGRGGSVPWPPRSPDLSPLDFFVWGYMKNEVYSAVVNTEIELRERILEAVEKVRQKLTYEVTVGAMRKRARACLRENGGHFEPKL